MVRLSRFRLTNRQLEKLFSLFFEVVGKNKSKSDFLKIISDVLSPPERIMIAKRIAIMYLLMKQVDHRIICHVLKVSTATVAKFAVVMEKSVGVIPLFDKMLRNEKIVEFFQDVFNAFFAPGVPGISWKSAWERKIASERKKAFGI
jgi:Trp operon repressor